MDGEQKENIGRPTDSAARARLRDLPGPELLKAVEVLREVVEQGRMATENVEFASSKEDLRALSDEELAEHLDVLEERIELEKRQNELDRKAVNLGLLKLADQAPRCSHLKSNGQPCRAPAMGNRSFCVFHVRAFDTTTDSPRINVSVLEDRQSLQITVKQIMEQIVAGRIEPQAASLLLRAVQIANSTLRPKRVRVESRKRKQVQSDTREDWGNAEESSA